MDPVKALQKTWSRRSLEFQLGSSRRIETVTDASGCPPISSGNVGAEHTNDELGSVTTTEDWYNDRDGTACRHDEEVGSIESAAKALGALLVDLGPVNRRGRLKPSVSTLMVPGRRAIRER